MISPRFRRACLHRSGCSPRTITITDPDPTQSRVAIQELIMETGFNHWKTCRHGTMLYNINDQYVGRSLELYGEFSREETELFDRIVKPGDTVIEAGANIGSHTLPLARLVGPSGSVFAFEPQRLVFQALCANRAMNSITNAYCFQQAVGREAGSMFVPFFEPRQPTNFGGIALRRDNVGERVPMIALDALELRSCRLLKVDVEGMKGKGDIYFSFNSYRRMPPFFPLKSRTSLFLKS